MDPSDSEMLILSFFLKVDPLGRYLPQHLFYILHTDTFLVKFRSDLNFWMFPRGDHGPLTHQAWYTFHLFYLLILVFRPKFLKFCLNAKIKEII